MHPIRLFLIVSALALASASAASAYSWPFKPFDQQQPIRGFFGDPRTIFENGILAGGFDGPGFFSFHQGVDISAPDGTPIYAVEDGTAHYVGASTLNIVTDHDVIFQFFHIVTVVGEGEQVVARKTMLGYVQPVPVPGKFMGLPVAPALVEWTLTRLGGTAVVPWRVVADFRTTLPTNAGFSGVYARGTYQNAP